MSHVIKKALLAAAYGAPRAATRFDPARLRRILAIRRNGIGDMICALPTLRALRRTFPEARLDILASEANAEIALASGAVDEVFVYRRGAGIFRNHYFNLYRIMPAIRAREHELAIAISGGPSALLEAITYATRIPWRIGFVEEGARSHACYNIPVHPARERQHQIESCLQLLEPLGAKPGTIDVSFALGEEHQGFAARVLAENGLSRGVYALYNVSSGRAQSRWRAERIAGTANALAARGLPLVLCGLAADMDLMRRIATLAGRPLAALATPTVLHFAALVKGARFLMCGDGGPMHVAAAMGTPAFVLFASTDPALWRPWGVPFAYIRSGSTVDAIEVAAVLERLQKWLQEIGRGDWI